jgi:hypothetical protein
MFYVMLCSVICFMLCYVLCYAFLLVFHVNTIVIILTLSPSLSYRYCCDVEGNLQYWENYLSISQVLRRGLSGCIELRDNCHFVFGGDACDRGPGDVRLLRDLAYLRDTYPNRVHYIMGNRDVNKMRLRAELSASAMLAGPGDVYWVPHGPPSGQSRPDKLRWMLEHTLGCPHSFDLRREELSCLLGRAEGSIGDEAVADSFTDLMAPDGLLTMHLLGAKLGIVLADACFFHGGLTPSILGKVPPGDRASRGGTAAGISPPPAPPAPAGIAADLLTEPLSGVQLAEGWEVCAGPVQAWFARLNGFAREEMQEYAARSERYCGTQSQGEAGTGAGTGEAQTGPETGEGTAEAGVGVGVGTGTGAEAGTGEAQTGPETGVGTGTGRGSYWAQGGGYTHPQPGSRLLQYGMGWTPDKEKNPSIVYNNWLSERGVPALPPLSVTEYLRRSGTCVWWCGVRCGVWCGVVWGTCVWWCGVRCDVICLCDIL